MSSKKVPVSQSQSPLAATPFASLQIEGLPIGEEVEAADSPAVKMGRIVLRKEKSQRGGKTVIVASNFAGYHSSDFLESLARKAKHVCGCGGTVAGREIELQGNDSTRIRKFFELEGFRVAGI